MINYCEHFFNIIILCFCICPYSTVTVEMDRKVGRERGAQQRTLSPQATFTESASD